MKYIIKIYVTSIFYYTYNFCKVNTAPKNNCRILANIK